MLPLDRAHLVRTLATRLSEKAGTWTPDGDTIRSQGSPMITVTDLHRVAPNHVDIGVAVNPENPEAPVIWDCAAGVGETSEDVAEMAAHMWVETTGSTVLELLTQRGELAAHIPGDDPDGLPGYHAIQGPMLVYGHDVEPLRQWVENNALLPALRSTLPQYLDPVVSGVKVLFGGSEENVEVRVDTEIREDVTAAVRALDYPRAGFARAFFIVFPEAD
jgi:hypothetical protein